MTLSVATARRGWATAEHVLNTRPLDTLLAGRRAAPDVEALLAIPVSGALCGLLGVLELGSVVGLGSPRPRRPAAARGGAPPRPARSRRTPGRRRSRRPGDSRWSASRRASVRPPGRSSVWVADRVASTARPRAPPTCWVVLTRPDTSPESSRVAVDIASVIRDGNERPGADAEQHHRGQQVGHVPRVDGSAAEQRPARRPAGPGRAAASPGRRSG